MSSTSGSPTCRARRPPGRRGIQLLHHRRLQPDRLQPVRWARGGAAHVHPGRGGPAARRWRCSWHVQPAPAVTGVSPSGGPIAGGTSVTVTGTNFTGATAVDFGATPGTGVVVNGAGTSLTVTSPARAAGTVDVTVVTPAGTSATSAADYFTYFGVPTVTGVAPRTGTTTGGNSVTVTGTNLAGATAVDFGANAGTGVVVNGAGTSLTASLAGRSSGDGRRHRHHARRCLAPSAPPTSSRTRTRATGWWATTAASSPSGGALRGIAPRARHPRQEHRGRGAHQRQQGLLDDRVRRRGVRLRRRRLRGVAPRPQHRTSPTSWVWCPPPPARATG